MYYSRQDGYQEDSSSKDARDNQGHGRAWLDSNECNRDGCPWSR